MALSQTGWSTITDLVSTGQNVSDSFDVAFTNIDTAILQIDANVLAITALQSPNWITMVPQVDPVAYAEGRFYYNDNTKTFNLQGPFDGIEVSPGHGEHIHVINNSGALIEAGMALRPDGIAGGKVQVVKALADTFEHARILGIAVIDIPIGAESAIATSGFVRNIDTNGLALGTPIYLSDTVAGTYSSVAPAIRSQVGGVFVADAINGSLYVRLVNNQNIPTVYGGLKGLDTAIPLVTTTAEDIVDYSLTREVVTTVDKTTGEITLPNDGDYATFFTASITFPSTISTRTIFLELYDVTNVTVHYTYKYNVPRDATEASLSFNWTLDELAGNVHKMRIRASENIAVVVDDISFHIASISIT